MARLIFIQLFICVAFACYGQTYASLPPSNDIFKKQIEIIGTDKGINADSAWSILSNWNTYPEINNTKKWYLFLYKDSVFGTVPLRVYVPENYQNDVSSPAVLILHGATVLSSFKDAYKDTASDEDLFYNYFAKHNFIIIRPFADGYGPHADGTIKFDWVVNFFNHFKGKSYRNKTNPTFLTLSLIISQLKQILNIDDNRVFAFGHSDGADGVFALDVLKPSCFAGFVAYNSLLTNIFAYDIFLRNTLNRPLYLVHSDLDDLRRIQQTRLIVKALDSINSPVLYKEYIGYKHYDKHLQIDLPYSYAWMKAISRNPFQKNISWELSDTIYNTCDWLKVTQFDTTVEAASWQNEFEIDLYNSRAKKFVDIPYYISNKSAVIKAFYNNNVFEIHTSRIKEIELFISPVMVNLLNPVIVKINGKEVFNKKITADKTFLLKNFAATFDRKALWVTSIKVKVN